MKKRIRIGITEGAKRHIARHGVRAEEVLTIFEQDYFVKREGKRYELILDFRHYKNLGTADRLRFATNNALISYQMHLQAFTETRSTLTHHLHTD